MIFSRHIEVVIRDEFNASRPFLFIVSVVSFNDLPQIIFDVTNVTYTINAPPIALFPSDIDLVDVDSATLSEIKISFEKSRFGDVINAGDFESVGIATERLDDGSLRLTGISTTANYLLAIKSLAYSTSIALSGYSIVDVAATDSDGAVSDAVRIFIQTNTTGCFREFLSPFLYIINNLLFSFVLRSSPGFCQRCGGRRRVDVQRYGFLFVFSLL